MEPSKGFQGSWNSLFDSALQADKTGHILRTLFSAKYCDRKENAWYVQGCKIEDAGDSDNLIN